MEVKKGIMYTHWKVCFYNESPANRNNKKIVKAEVTIKITVA